MAERRIGWRPRRKRGDFDPAAAEPFAIIAARTNMRRIGIGSAAALLNMIAEIYYNITGGWLGDGVVAIACIPVYIVLITISLRNRVRDPEVMTALTLFNAVFILGAAHIGTAVLASNGRITSGYALTAMAIALVYILPPRTLLWLFGTSLLLFLATMWRMPASNAEKIVAAVNATMAAGVAIVSGWLIYATRARDYEQRLLIQHQNRLITASKHELDEMMALTAHDLHSPMLGLRNLIDLTIKQAPDDPALPVEVLEQSLPSLDAMLRLVRRLLEAHRAERDEGAPPVCDDLRLHLSAAIDRARPMARSAGAPIVLDVPAAPVLAIFDPAAVAQMLDNLLANAVRFSPVGEPVTARCREADGLATVAIEDCGPGIAEDQRPTLFDKFRQGSTMPRYGPPGTGIGLYIVATLAARIGASIAYRPAESGGSIFEFTLATTVSPRIG